jgi:hypothetical protein
MKCIWRCTYMVNLLQQHVFPLLTQAEEIWFSIVDSIERKIVILRRILKHVEMRRPELKGEEKKIHITKQKFFNSNHLPVFMAQLKWNTTNGWKSGYSFFSGCVYKTCCWWKGTRRTEKKTKKNEAWQSVFFLFTLKWVREELTRNK